MITFCTDVVYNCKIVSKKKPNKKTVLQMSRLL